MKQNIESVLKKIFNEMDKSYIWDDGMIRTLGPGHTREVSTLSQTHIGRFNANYYACAIIHDSIGELEGLKLLQQLSKLQVKDNESEQRGGFRWYREETAIEDTNAAFFIMMPLVFTQLYYAERIPFTHKQVMDEMMAHSFYWFQKECSNPILYYSNKIISDGAMLLGISSILNIEHGYQEGVNFFKRWDEYTERRGWGWGENISFNYLGVILNALQLSRKALSEEEKGLKNILKKRIDYVLEFVRFHAGKEMVPTIRSYNFNGQDSVYGWINTVAGVRFVDKDVSEDRNNEWGVGKEKPFYSIINLKMFEEYFDNYECLKFNDEKDTENIINKAATPIVWSERTFDDTFAYTWKGKTGKLGSVNKFPIIPGSYQWPGWGLGWQSMPVCFLVNGEQFSFLRIFVKEGNNLRSHPAIDKKKAYLNPALFRESYLPNVHTYCAQNENMLFAVRSINNISNYASEIIDGWVVNRFKGEYVEYTIQTKNIKRQWILLKYRRATVAISCLKGIKFGDQKLGSIKMQLVDNKGDLTIQQTLYKGEEQLLQQQKIEAGWVVIYIDEYLENEKVKEFLSKVEIEDKEIHDYEVPRNGYTKIRELSMKLGIDKKVELKLDPYLN